MPDTVDLHQLKAARLNKDFFGIGLDRAALHAALESELGEPGLARMVEERCPHAFATHPIFLSARHKQGMEALISAVEYVVSLPAFRAHVLGAAPAIAQHDPGGAKGIFFGYDFHVDENGFGLIEINTNAGGAMLNAALARAQRACCPQIEHLQPLAGDPDDLEARIVAMIHHEWLLSGHKRPLRSVAIVDEAPAQQYLYPEFILFQRLFERHGLQAVIADPRELRFHGGALWVGETEIDLVYNRLTDFMLESAASMVLRAAYLADAVVLTPHPRAHALYADKRNLASFTDPTMLTDIGVPEDVQSTLLKGIPRTEIVTRENADRLWADRRRLFFKPTAGFGSKAAYRGEKLTRRVWQEIVAGQYVAQALVAPGERVIDFADQRQALKFDVRSYVYDGEPQWLAARLYQGQTTNFRTPGGGFAAVYSLPTSPTGA